MMKRRFRKKSHNSGGDRRSINPLKHSYESGGSGSRMRGNAQQLHEKYMGLGREAKGNGDRIMMEHYFQYAEHYQRQINQFQENMESRNQGWDDFSDSPRRGNDRGDRNDRDNRDRGDRGDRPRRPSNDAPIDDTPIEDNGDNLPLPGPIATPAGDDDEEAPRPRKAKAKASRARPRRDDDEAPVSDEDML